MSDITHDPALRSWVASANAAGTDFPVQNLPYGRFRRAGSDEPWRIGVAIGDQVLDLGLAASQCPWGASVLPLLQPLAGGDLVPLMSGGTDARRVLREALSQALREDSEQAPFLELCLLPQAEAEMDLPCRIGDYTDFYTGIHHATAVGALFRPGQSLPPNYKWVPIGYHGRSSSIRVSGHGVVRPHGQFRGVADGPPEFGPTRQLDYELELGAFVGQGNELGNPVAIDDAQGACSACACSTTGRPGTSRLGEPAARAIPVEELLHDCLAVDRHDGGAGTLPLRVDEAGRRSAAAAVPRVDGQPRARRDRDHARGLAADHGNARARRGGRAALAVELPGCLLDTGPTPDAPHQQRLQPRAGDLFGTGTQSGRSRSGRFAARVVEGRRPGLDATLGETRSFLLDGDSVILRAWCQREGGVRIGFGDCTATVLKAD